MRVNVKRMKDHVGTTVLCASFYNMIIDYS